MIVPMLPHLTKNPDHIKTVGAFLKNAQNSARSDDISRLRDHIIKYIYEAEGIQMPDSGLEKSRRGWNCEATARMLCPRDLRDEFDADPTSFCRDVRNGQRFVDHDDWPTLVYSATEYDTSKIEYGLLKSPFLVNCWKTIFQGPNSVRATSSKKGGRSTLAQAYEIKQVDEYSIIYTTILARFLLSSGTWDANDGPFMGVEFFKNLLYLFEDSVEWRKDTLAWWNARVFGCQAPGMQSSRVNPTRTGLSSVAKLKQQREAQRNQMRIQPPQRRASIAADN
ncbi:hypothetical protein DAEQUDRAFT_730060 [Daedalea quercina L-15889]|uniref:Fungal-type protein kinase domain-containing protein n=1 Tax=Daedalea quercina L-15889 TaxID=1314783 RepID=A0A165N8B4_9APHY|nr:hypothetical protein DAEQUDRAFT_730060 [Daedalea quercina L-15889]